jgi:hypothetical protein
VSQTGKTQCIRSPGEVTYHLACDVCGASALQIGRQLPPYWSYRYIGSPSMYAPSHVCSVMCAERWDFDHDRLPKAVGA